MTDEHKKQWELPPELRETGFECLAFHRGKWRHVCWSPHGWSLGYGKPMMIDANARSFAELPSLPEGFETNFYGWVDQ